MSKKLKQKWCGDPLWKWIQPEIWYWLIFILFRLGIINWYRPFRPYYIERAFSDKVETWVL